MPEIHLWCPSIRASDGGIESYSRSLAEALVKIAGRENVTILVRNHGARDLKEAFGPDTRHRAVGRLPEALRTIGFAILVVAQALLNRPDLIISTHLNFSPFAALVKRLTTIPYWIALHGYESWEIRRPSQRRAVEQADRLLPVSHFTRNRVIDRYSIAPDRMRVLHDTFDAARFSIGPKPDHLLRRYGWAADDPVILTVGRLAGTEQYKGHDRIIRALARIRTELPKVKYLIVGGGDDKARLEQITRDEKVTDAVRFAGRVPNEELGHYYQLCDLFAMPSTGEGFGIAFLEALAAGKPVVAGTDDGAVDALCGGELGVLVDPHDTKGLAEAVTALLQRRHPHPLANHPHELRARVIEAFGPSMFQRSVAQLLAEKA